MALSLRVGVALGDECVRAVALKRGTRSLVWRGERTVVQGESSAHALEALLHVAQLPRWPRPVTVVAFGLGKAQLKVIKGLPPVTEARVLNALVAENTDRFFLRNGAPLLTSHVWREPDGSLWAAAFSRPLVTDVQGACGRAGVRLAEIVPAPVALAAATAADRLLWDDSGARFTVQKRGRWGLEILPSAQDGTSSHDAPPMIPGLEVFGQDAAAFMVSYSAAMETDRGPLVINPNRRALSDRVSRTRATAALAVVPLALAFAAAAPGLRAIQLRRSALQQMERLEAQEARALKSLDDLGRVTAALQEAQVLAASGRSVTVLLARLEEALPVGAAMTALRVDSTGGSVVILAQSAASAVARIERVPGVLESAIVGPVTREVLGGSTLERFTLRFRYLSSGSRGSGK